MYQALFKIIHFYNDLQKQITVKKDGKIHL